MKSLRDLRLYPNRRLYDPDIAQYVTYDDVFTLLQGGVGVSVRDTLRGKDETLKVLAGLLFREELRTDGHRQQIFTDGLLKELIRLSATEKAPTLKAFLDHSMNALTEMKLAEDVPANRR